MKKLFVSLFSLFCFSAIAQLQAPKASPLAKIEQRVGLSDFKVEYSRPLKNGRDIFGALLPYGEMWRAGANENTKFTCSDAIIFGKDTLKAGTYAIFIQPEKTSWDIIFYTDFSNWGTPDTWDDKKVAIKQTVPVTSLKEVVESFTISFDQVGTKEVILSFSWDKVKVALPLNVPTDEKMMAAIQKTMSGPSGADYYAAAEYYFKEKKDMTQALAWVNKAIEQRPTAFWMLRTKSLIQAELGDFKGAIETAKVSLAEAEKASYTTYVDLNKASISEWEKKK